MVFSTVLNIGCIGRFIGRFIVFGLNPIRYRLIRWADRFGPKSGRYLEYRPIYRPMRFAEKSADMDKKIAGLS
jgi:hypothetical protein